MSDLPFIQLHLGLGAFHRAHQAAYQQQLLDLGHRQWQLISANLRPNPDGSEQALIAQGGRYTLLTIAPDGAVHYQPMTALHKVIPHSPGLAQVIACGADPRTRIVSFTVTESGYYLDANGQLDADIPELAQSLARTRASAAQQADGNIYSAISALLQARCAAGAGPLTLLNCDNLRHNGERFRAALLRYLQLAGLHELHAWAQDNTTCPNAMVDRITPRPPPELRQRVLADTGCDDAAPVMAERYLQWVIEDNFIASRPPWEEVGVEMVASVAPYEEAKIRILNASHSAIAWAGTLRGLSYIHEGVSVPEIRTIAHNYVSEDVIPCLDVPGNPIDLAAYRDTVLARFANPAIADTNQRVAMDGFAKIPGFIAPTIRQRLQRGESIAATAALPALFLAFLQRWHQHLLPYHYQDQAMNPDTAHAICAAADPVVALCADSALWGEMANHPQLVHAVRQALQKVQTN